MADIADFANDLVQDGLDHILAKRAALKTATVLPSLEICAECLDPIPEGRRLAQPGCTFCIECQSVDDLRAARYAR
ncbi:TraR/DksA C4-type zinc finger protein [Pseudomonas extremaustralis]|uniref:TraR/DksA C4-type zinc finger protein n=1 Tax=Pseudomonas extremaustralis TaxID=359110 RepID=UPI0021C78161|nr:TraR/DksA C4-type zinc finger protein [Pseudomonas extremaustralis]UUJ42366.1 TraR/DksA C4-type zinc finger protein [Pseudomonas extremaustralis]